MTHTLKKCLIIPPFADLITDTALAIHPDTPNPQGHQSSCAASSRVRCGRSGQSASAVLNVMRVMGNSTAPGEQNQCHQHALQQISIPNLADTLENRWIHCFQKRPVYLNGKHAVVIIFLHYLPPSSGIPFRIPKSMTMGSRSCPRQLPWLFVYRFTVTSIICSMDYVIYDMTKSPLFGQTDFDLNLGMQPMSNHCCFSPNFSADLPLLCFVATRHTFFRFFPENSTLATRFSFWG